MMQKISISYWFEHKEKCLKTYMKDLGKLIQISHTCEKQNREKTHAKEK